MNKSLICAVLGAALLSACASSSSDLKYEFKSDRPAPKSTLEVPPDLSLPAQQDRYPIPQVTQDAAAKPATAPAAPVAANPASNPAAATSTAASVERAGNQRWLTLPGKRAAEVWPLLKAFWLDNGFVIQKEEADIGYMETDWAENRAKLGGGTVRGLLETVGLGSVMSTPERDMFRIRVEQTASGTDVFFSHRGMYEIYINEAKEETRWQPRPADPEIEAVFLNRFLVRLGADEASAAKALSQASAAQQAAKARLVAGGIELDDSFDRAWRRVGLVLEHNGLAITDRDRTLGAYFVKPASDDNQKAAADNSSLLSKLAFWKDSPQNGSDKKAVPNLRVQLTRQGDSKVRIELRNADNAPVADNRVNALLQQMVNELK